MGTTYEIHTVQIIHEERSHSCVLQCILSSMRLSSFVFASAEIELCQTQVIAFRTIREKRPAILLLPIALV